MGRGKKTASRGRGGGRGGRGGGRGGARLNGNNHSASDYDLDSDFVPFAGSSSHGLSLQAEALNTQRHESHWSSTSKLRFSKVSFVSAGVSDPSEQKAVEEKAASEEVSQKNNEGAMAGMSLKDTDMKESAAKEPTPQPAQPADEEDHAMSDDLIGDIEAILDASFVVDTEGAEPILTGLPPPRVRSPSPALSNSSEEVILFGGRDSTGRAIRRPSPVRTAQSFRRVVQDEVTVTTKPSADASATKPTITQAVKTTKTSRISIDPASEPSMVTEPKSTPSVSKKQDHLNKKSKKKSVEDELMADYIENIRNQGLDPSAPYGQRELGGTDSEGELEADENEFADRQFEGSDRDIPSDFDDMSTADGVEGLVDEVLSMRTRKSGLQYLLVWEGQEMHEAKWVPETALFADQAKEKIAKYHLEEKLMAEVHCTDSEADSDDEEEDDDEEDIEEGSDDDEAIRKDKQTIDSLSDAQIARLLAKQEELGMGSDELMIFDGLGDEDDDDEDDLEGYLPARLSRRKPRINKKDGTVRNAKGEYPSATKTADAYDGFDVMDFERPSISVKKRTKKNKKPVFDISDSELERSLEDAWDLDRMKKSQKKKDREELRAQGLLGSKSGKPDMKQKYKEGMGIDSVKEELKQFLQGSNTTLALPPMDKHFRKMVHEIANAFNLKSKSQGSGSKRFPVLIRTQRTMVYSENVFMGAQRHMGGRFMPRMDKSMRVSRTTTRVGFKSGGGGNGYRDGDVVGESAPELGVENRGRAMLEKMGWSSGTALGALNNKGILQPVSQVVKTSKAGLG